MSPHPREVFEGYAVDIPSGDWSYELDDFGVSYTSGAWPYHRDYVRLAPNVTYRSWANEYVNVWQDLNNPQQAVAEMKVITRRQGVGAYTVRVAARLDLRTETVTFDPDDLDGELREQALAKAQRVLELFAVERARRDGPDRPDEPITAYDRAVASGRLVP